MSLQVPDAGVAGHLAWHPREVAAHQRCPRIVEAGLTNYRQVTPARNLLFQNPPFGVGYFDINSFGGMTAHNQGPECTACRTRDEALRRMYTLPADGKEASGRC